MLTDNGKTSPKQGGLTIKTDQEVNDLTKDASPSKNPATSPYLRKQEELSSKMLKMTQENDSLKVRVKQLTQALQTSLFQRQMNHKVLTE